MSNKPNYKTARKYKCPYCDLRATRGELVDHVEKAHEDLIPEGYTAARVVFDSINGKNYGTCMICKSKVYEWNDKINRYYNLCKKPECRNKVRETALARHMKVYNKPTLLNDAEHQEKMLANRRISGTYTFSDGKKFTYTGKYERNALEFMDKVLEIPSSDILTPGPVLEYEYEGETHKWITDIFYIPANLIIEIKDGGSNPNTRTMTSYRDKQVAKEVMITDKGAYNYIRLTNNNFAQLLDIFADMKNGALNNDPKSKVHINESVRARSFINEAKSQIDKDFESKGQIQLSSLKKIHITEDVINKYKKDYPCLKHVRCKDTKEYTCDGYMWMDNDKLACMVGSCEYNDDLTKWIVSLEVMPEYKGYGLSKQILDYAVKSMNCKYLSVNKNNEIAKHVYDTYGFKVYQESDTMYYMTLETNINEAANNKNILYFLSDKNLDNATLNPRIPDNYFTKHGYEDGETKRVCFSTSINSALMALSRRFENQELFVHTPINPDIDVYSPSTKEVPDVNITYEKWVLNPVKVKCIGKIVVTGDAGKPGHRFAYGNNTAELYDWNWKWIEKNIDEYYIDFRKSFNEEVGGLPPHRPPEAYIVPYGMNNVFDGYAYTDSEMDKFITIDDDNHILPMAESVFYETFTTGPVLYYAESDVSARIKKIHEAIGDNGKFGKYEIVGHLVDGPIYKAEDVLLSGKFKYYDKDLEEQTLKMLENGIAVKINGDTDIVETIGNVFIHISPNGYYATTPDDFYLASAYFENRESLDASGIVGIMNDIYASNSKTKGEIRDV